MQTAFLIITDECSQSCPWCFNLSPAAAAKASLSSTEYIRIIGTIRDLGFSSIIFTGGEPLEDEHIYDYLSHAQALGLRAVLLSSGGALDKHRLQKLQTAGLENITVSLNDITESTKDQFIDTDQERQELFDSIEHYFSRFTLTILLSKKNISYLDTIYNSCNRPSTSLIFQPVYCENSRTLANTLSLKNISPDDWQNLKLKLADWMIANNTYTYIQLIQDSYTSRQRPTYLTCLMGSQTMVIDTAGDAFPCFHRQDISIGNLLRDDPRDLMISLLQKSEQLITAPCFSSRCVSLFLTVPG